MVIEVVRQTGYGIVTEIPAIKVRLQALMAAYERGK